MGIYREGFLPMPPADLIDDRNDLGLPPVADVASVSKPPDIEREVIELYEHFRNPALRYALSFGIPVHDAEEIAQEAFLCLFRHLPQRRSRKNLLGWIFRVAHNLALKQRQMNQESHARMAPGPALAEGLADTSANPEEQPFMRSKAATFAGRRPRSPRSRSGLPRAARGGTSLPGDCSDTRYFCGSSFNVADAFAGTLGSRGP